MADSTLNKRQYRPPEMTAVYTLQPVHPDVEQGLFPADRAHTQPPVLATLEDAAFMVAFSAPDVLVGGFDIEDDAIAKIVRGSVSYTFNAKGMVE